MILSKRELKDKAMNAKMISIDEIEAMIASQAPVDLNDDQPEQPKIETIVIQATSVVVLPDGKNKATFVLFRPTDETLDAVREHRGNEIKIEIDDESGLFSNYRIYTITKVTIGCENTTIVNTKYRG